MNQRIPVGKQWQVGADDIAAIAAAFGLTLTDAPPQALGGAINGVVRVGTNRGDVVFRVHRPETTPARLAAVHGVQDRLRAHGLPIPAVLRTPDGAAWTTVDDRLSEVLRYVPYEHEAETWDDGAATFAMLGRLHAVLRWLRDTNLPPPAYGCYAAPAAALALLAESEPAFLAQRHDPAFAAAAEVRASTAELLHRLHAARQEYESALPRQLIHGDYVGHNVLVAGGRVVAILDFDRMALRERVHELACALFVLLNRLTRNRLTQRGADGRLTASDLANVARLLQRYESAAGWHLTATELAALPYEMARTPLYPVVAADFGAAEAVSDTPRVAPNLPPARWLADQATHVGGVLRDLIGRMDAGSGGS